MKTNKDDQGQQEFIERFFYQTVGTHFQIKAHLHSEHSPYQKIDVYDTYGVGKLLTLDGKTMVSDKDEFVYHEVLCHIPYMVSRDTKKVLIIGGGDGGLVREYCRYPSLQQIDLVEIDERVVEVSKMYFPHCTQSLNDHRVRIHYKDGIEFIKNAKNTYDIIVIDSTDPENFASGLFTQEFYAHVNEALTDGGIMVAQTENPFYDQYNIRDIYRNLRAAFPIVNSFTAPMIIYPGVFWTFAFASKRYQPQDIYMPKYSEYQSIKKDLKWYCLSWHRGAFMLSKFHRKHTGPWN